VLSAEDNEILTRVGPGTPMGNLLRRYWIPACLSSEIGTPDGPPARVRLLGEDLVAFRDTGGAVGLIEERCPHRGASLFYGRPTGITSPPSRRPTRGGWAGRSSSATRSTRSRCCRERRRAPRLHPRERLPDRPVRAEGALLQRDRGLQVPGRDGDRDRRADLRPDDRAPRHDRRRPDPNAPAAPAGGQGAGRRPGGGAAGPRRGGRLPRDPRRGEDPRRRRGLARPRHRRRPHRRGGALDL
jgi:hypothetical protein